MIPELKTFLIAMSPIIELRGSIPIALKVYGLSVWSAYIFSVLGNIVPLILIISILSPISKFLSQKSLFLKKIFDWIFNHTRSANESKIARWGKKLAVVILVATPIPFVGGWTGALAAFVFEIPFKKALPLVVLGSIISGAIVLVLTLGLSNLI